MQIMSDPILQARQHNTTCIFWSRFNKDWVYFLSLRVVIIYETYRKEKSQLLLPFSHGVFLSELNNYGFVVVFFLPLATWESFAIIVLFSFTLLIFSLSVDLFFSLFCFLWVKRVFHVCTRIFICPFRHLQYRILCQHTYIYICIEVLCFVHMKRGF